MITEITELCDTVELMNSPDYRQRMRAEYLQTAIRYRRLTEMLSRFEMGKLGFVPKCPIELLARQADVMREYIRLLEMRAGLEGVRLLGDEVYGKERSL